MKNLIVLSFFLISISIQSQGFNNQPLDYIEINKQKIIKPKWENILKIILEPKKNLFNSMENYGYNYDKKTKGYIKKVDDSLFYISQDIGYLCFIWKNYKMDLLELVDKLKGNFKGINNKLKTYEIEKKDYKVIIGIRDEKQNGGILTFEMISN